MIRRAIDIIRLGLMMERTINDPHEEVYFKHNGQSDVLRVDAFVVVTPSEADVVSRVWKRAES